jgi:7-carboxy-7-deazaguanine synthase
MGKITFSVVEIFHSIQGEGKLAGRPSVFLRLAGCPIRCCWCDTKRAWKTGNYPELSLDEIFEKVSGFSCKNLVITGGEPTIHSNLPTLIKRFKDDGFHCTLETAGIIYRKVNVDLLSISPKWNEKKSWIKPAILKKLIRDADDYQIKWVAGKKSDVRNALLFLKTNKYIVRDTFMLMPKANTLSTYQKISPKTAAWCLENNFCFSPRLHLELQIK